MSTSAESFSPDSTTNDAIGSVDRWLRARLFEKLDLIKGGRITIRDALGIRVLGEQGHDGLHMRMDIHSGTFYREIASNGSVGAGESYMAGHWQCDDLVGLVRLLVRNRDLLDGVETGPARLGGWIMKAMHSLRRNTRTGSRKNIAAHYDLGNALFKIFLDENMMYSSAIFADDGDSLETASTRKLDRICQKLDLQPGEHLLEIGTGWGGMALHAARRSAEHARAAVADGRGAPGGEGPAR